MTRFLNALRNAAIVAYCLVVAITPTSSRAQSPLAFADFSTYANGGLVGQNGWQLYSTATTGAIQVADGKATLIGGGAGASDNQDAILSFNQQVSNPISGTNVITLDMLLSVATSSTAAPSYFAAINQLTGTATSGNFQNSRLAVQASGTGFVFGARVNGQLGYPYGFGTTVLGYNQDYALRAQINQVAGNANDFITLYVGPDFNTLDAYSTAGYSAGTVVNDPAFGALLFSQFSSPTAYGSTVSVKSVATSVLLAVEPTWSNPSEGLFNSPANWSGGSVPTPSEAAVINNSGTAVLLASGRVSLATLRVGRDGAGTMVIGGGGVAGSSGTSAITFVGMTQINSATRGEGRIIIDGSSTLRLGGSLGMQIGTGSNSLGAFGSLTVRHGSSYVHAVTGAQGIEGDLYVGLSGGADGVYEGVLDVDGGSVIIQNTEFEVGTGVGSGTGHGTVIIQNGGSLTVNNWTKFGGKPGVSANPSGGGFGVLNISSGTFLKSGTGNLIFGDKIGAAEVNQSGGVVSVEGGELIIGGHGSAGVGTYHLSSGTLSVADNAGVGRYGGAGMLQMTGGTIIKTGRGQFEVGSGSVDPRDTGTPGTGFMAMSGGLLDIRAGDLVISAGVGAGSSGTMAISGEAVIRSPRLFIGKSVRASGALFIEDGRMEIASVIIGAGLGGVGRASVSGGIWTGGDFFVGESGTGSLSLSGGAVSGVNLMIGVSAQSIGEGSVSGGTFGMTGSVVVGVSGTGTLNVTGGSVTNAGGVIGENASGNGTATVSGGTWANGGNLTVGVSGTGTLTMTGGLVTVGGMLSKGTYGTINLQPGGTLQIGTGGTTGVLGVSTLTNNGTLVFNRSDASTYAGLISGSGSIIKQGSGTLTLTGTLAANSAVVVDRAMTVEAGTLAIVQGGTGRLWIGSSGSVGLLRVSGGRVTNLDGWLGAEAGGYGSAIVSSGTWANARYLDVGASGTGSLVLQGGMVGSANAAVGWNAGSYGVALVSGGTWSSAGYLSVGDSGSGSLRIEGGVVTNTTGYLGNNAGSVGTAMITGGTWANSSELIVGNSGTGTLRIQGGKVANGGELSVGRYGTALLHLASGTLTDRRTRIGYYATGTGSAEVNGGEWINDDFFYVGVFGSGRLRLTGGVIRNTYAIAGYDPGADGNIEVSGGKWLSSDFLVIGRKGTATMTITDGYFENTNGVVGYYAEGSGAVLIAGGTWANSGNLTVGLSGTGTLNVTGGRVSNTTGFLGYNAGSIGTAHVLSGTWANSGQLTVGYSGTGTLNVNGGSVTNTDGYLGRFGSVGTATVSSGTWANSGDLNVGVSGTGTLTMTGGLVTVGGMLSKGTYGTINLQPGGTLQIGTGGTTGVLGVSSLTNNGTLVFNRSDASAYSGVLSGTGAISKQGGGTLTFSGPNTLTGPTTIRQGTLQLAHASALSASTISVLAGGTLALTPELVTTIGGLKPNAGGVVDVGTGLITVSKGLSVLNAYVALVTGRGDGAWDGASGITSSAAASSNGTRTVGWLDNGNGSVTFAYAAAGDTNLDWIVDVLDVAKFIAAGKYDSDLTATWAEGDFNYDGFADITDAADFFATGLYDAGPYNSASGAIAAVPEPNVLGLIGVGAGVVGLMAMRRKRAA